MGMVKTFGIGMLGLGHVGRQGGMSPVVDTEPTYRIFTDENGLQWRQGIRDGWAVLDVALTPTGFAGDDNVDWKLVEETYINNGENLTIDEMKYPIQTINLVAATPKVVTTTLTSEPYSIMVLDSSGNEITASVEILVEFTGGVYVVTLTSASNENGVKLKILY